MSDNRTEAWAKLEAAALARTQRASKETADALSAAAKAWAACNGYVSAVGGASRSDGAVFPNYGRSKGLPVRGASRGDLEFYAMGCRRALADEGKARWHEKERALLAAIEAELAASEGAP